MWHSSGHLKSLFVAYFIEEWGISQHVHDNAEMCSLVPGKLAGSTSCLYWCFSCLDSHIDVSLGMEKYSSDFSYRKFCLTGQRMLGTGVSCGCLLGYSLSLNKLWSQFLSDFGQSSWCAFRWFSFCTEFSWCALLRLSPGLQSTGTSSGASTICYSEACREMCKCSQSCLGLLKKKT